MKRPQLVLNIVGLGGGGTGLSRSNNLVELDHSCGVGWGVQCAPWFKVR